MNTGTSRPVCLYETWNNNDKSLVSTGVVAVVDRQRGERPEVQIATPNGCVGSGAGISSDGTADSPEDPTFGRASLAFSDVKLVISTVSGWSIRELESVSSVAKRHTGRHLFIPSRQEQHLRAFHATRARNVRATIKATEPVVSFE